MEFKGAVTNVRFQPNGENLAVSIYNDKIHILDKEFESLETCEHNLGSIKSMSFNMLGTQLASCFKGELKIWSTVDYTLV